MNDTDAIDGRRQEWVAVVNARDPAGYAALFTPDGVWVPPGQPAVRGREAIHTWLRPFFEQFDYDFSMTDSQLRVAGDWAVECGKFTSNLRPRSGGELSSHSGSYVVLWRRELDERWYIERYMDVTDLL